MSIIERRALHWENCIEITAPFETPRDVLQLFREFYRVEDGPQATRKFKGLQNLHTYYARSSSGATARFRQGELEVERMSEGRLTVQRTENWWEGTRFTIGNYQMGGTAETCVGCGAEVTEGYCKIKRASTQRPFIYSLFPYFGFHALSEHDSFQGKGSRSGKIELYPEAFTELFTGTPNGDGEFADLPSHHRVFRGRL